MTTATTLTGLQGETTYTVRVAALSGARAGASVARCHDTACPATRDACLTAGRIGSHAGTDARLHGDARSCRRGGGRHGDRAARARMGAGRAVLRSCRARLGLDRNRWVGDLHDPGIRARGVASSRGAGRRRCVARLGRPRGDRAGRSACGGRARAYRAGTGSRPRGGRSIRASPAAPAPAIGSRPGWAAPARSAAPPGRPAANPRTACPGTRDRRRRIPS